MACGQAFCEDAITTARWGRQPNCIFCLRCPITMVYHADDDDNHKDKDNSNGKDDVDGGDNDDNDDDDSIDDDDDEQTSKYCT